MTRNAFRVRRVVALVASTRAVEVLQRVVVRVLPQLAMISSPRMRDRVDQWALTAIEQELVELMEHDARMRERCRIELSVIWRDLAGLVVQPPLPRLGPGTTRATSLARGL